MYGDVVLPEASYPERMSFSDIYPSHQLTFEYFPTAAEWLFFVETTSLARLVFLIGCCRWWSRNSPLNGTPEVRTHTRFSSRGR